MTLIAAVAARASATSASSGAAPAALSGYRDVCGRSGSLVWFLERVNTPAPVALAA